MLLNLRTAARIALLSWLFAGCAEEAAETGPDPPTLFNARATAGAAPGYVEDAVCGRCHAEMYESYQKVGMAQSFKRPDTAIPMEDFGVEFYHEPLQRYYVIEEHEEGLLFRRYQRDSNGGVINEVRVPVAWIMGSGNRTRSYLYQTEWGEMFMLPIGWYSEDQRWAMSPGFESGDHPGIHRQIPLTCMFCLNAFAEVPQGSDTHWSVETFPHDLPQGTGCQRWRGARKVSPERQGD